MLKIISGSGCNTLMVSEVLQPFESNTVNVYVLASKLKIESLLALVGSKIWANGFQVY